MCYSLIDKRETLCELTCQPSLKRGVVKHGSSGSNILCVVWTGGGSVRRRHPHLGSKEGVSRGPQAPAETRGGAPHVRHRLADVPVHAAPPLQHTATSLGPLLLLR